MEYKTRATGAAWKKPTKNGGSFLSVKVEMLEDIKKGDSVWINIFEQKYKKSEKSPDWKTLEDRTKQEPKTETPMEFGAEPPKVDYDEPMF